MDVPAKPLLQLRYHHCGAEFASSYSSQHHCTPKCKRAARQQCVDQRWEERKAQLQAQAEQWLREHQLRPLTLVINNVSC
jgi:hypothetical protein